MPECGRKARQKSPLSVRRRGPRTTRPPLCSKHYAEDRNARLAGKPSPAEGFTPPALESKPLVNVGSGRVTELAKAGLEQGASDAGVSLYAFVNELLETAGLKFARKLSKR